MRNSIIAGAVVALIAGNALAQTQNPMAQNPTAQNPPVQNPPAAKGPQNPAISGSSKPLDVPVAGRNSFTEGEARARIEKMGFTNVGQLKKDEHGVWRGLAIKNGRQVQVSLDYQGNVVAR